MDVTQEKIDELVTKVKNSDFPKQDVELIVAILSNFLQIRIALEQKSLKLKTFLRKMFGLKTESIRSNKNGNQSNGDDKDDPPDDGQPPTSSPTNPANEDDSKRKKGHGRNGRDQFPDAKKVNCEHDSLKPGDTCPECGIGTLKEEAPGIHYYWEGATPLVVTIFLLQRLVCQDRSCRAVFKAPLPDVVQSPRFSDEKSGTIDTIETEIVDARRSRTQEKERTYDNSAAAMVVCMRYEFGVPHERLSVIQYNAGMPLPQSTQWGLVMQCFEASAIIYRYLWWLASSGKLVLNDDSWMRILFSKGNEYKGQKIYNKDGSIRKKIQTTAIVSFVDDREVVLYATGYKNAGENLNDLLSARSPDLAKPDQMCDGLPQNIPRDHKTNLGNCLDHGRRKFFDIQSSFENETKTVLDLMRVIYKNDKKTRDMTDQDRLEYHQKYSTEPWDQLHTWFKEVLGTEVEENSILGREIKYMLKRWKEFSKFLSVPGFPIANSECERMIKKIMPHRKNSMFYKTSVGAYVGDCFLSIIATCYKAKKAVHPYIRALSDHLHAVRKNPGDWLPWNYEQNILHGTVNPT